MKLLIRLTTLVGLTGSICCQSLFPQGHPSAIALPVNGVFISQQTADVYLKRGVFETKHKNYQAAILAFNQAIQLNPKFSLAYTFRGAVHILLEDFQSAHADIEQALKLDPKSSYAYYFRGFAYLKQGNRQDAISDYERAIQLNPKLAVKHRNYTRTARRSVIDKQSAIATQSFSPASSSRLRVKSNQTQSNARFDEYLQKSRRSREASDRRFQRQQADSRSILQNSLQQTQRLRSRL